MAEKQPIERAKKARRKGRSPSTQSGEFVREEMQHNREVNREPVRPIRPLPSDSQKRAMPALIPRRKKVKLPVGLHWLRCALFRNPIVCFSF
jgi:hypothetical protein